MLFAPPSAFQGLPESGFGLFSIPDRSTRRRAILETIHPALAALGEDLLARLSAAAVEPLHAHLPRLDWPKDYEPFCTWLALSRQAHGYQSGPQLNVGVHAEHVSVRLGWDTSSDAFARFEFLGRHGEVGERMRALAVERNLRFRVYASAPWPEGSRCVLETPDSLGPSFDEVRRRGVWWELGRRWDLPADLPFVCSPEFGAEATRIFQALLPLYDRIEGEHSA
jgi:hypothetical protein